MHPIFQRLIEVKWGFFGKRAWLKIFLNVLLTVVYTVLGITHPGNAKSYYFPLSKESWRIPLEVLVLILTFNEIRNEVKEFYQSRRENEKFITWRKKEIKRDLQYSHPRWTQEERYIEQQVRQLKERKRLYFQDFWNYFDWITYVMLIIVTTLHVINVFFENDKYNKVCLQIHACTIILVWIRLLKFARPFPGLGPLVVILDNIVRDTFRWCFVAGMFYIPYAAAFWMLFGGRSEHPVKGYDTVFLTSFIPWVFIFWGLVTTSMTWTKSVQSWRVYCVDLFSTLALFSLRTCTLRCCQIRFNVSMTTHAPRPPCSAPASCKIWSRTRLTRPLVATENISEPDAALRKTITM